MEEPDVKIVQITSDTGAAQAASIQAGISANPSSSSGGINGDSLFAGYLVRNEGSQGYQGLDTSDDEQFNSQQN